MKNSNITKAIVLASSVLPTAVFAHSGHVEEVAGHTHTLAELAATSAVPAIAIVAVASLVLWVLAKRNG